MVFIYLLYYFLKYFFYFYYILLTTASLQELRLYIWSSISLTFPYIGLGCLLYLFVKKVLSPGMKDGALGITLILVIVFLVLFNIIYLTYFSLYYWDIISDTFWFIYTYIPIIISLIIEIIPILMYLNIQFNFWFIFFIIIKTISIWSTIIICSYTCPGSIFIYVTCVFCILLYLLSIFKGEVNFFKIIFLSIIYFIFIINMSYLSPIIFYLFADEFLINSIDWWTENVYIKYLECELECELEFKPKQPDIYDIWKHHFTTHCPNETRDKWVARQDHTMINVWQPRTWSNESQLGFLDTLCSKFEHPNKGNFTFTKGSVAVLRDTLKANNINDEWVTSDMTWENRPSISAIANNETYKICAFNRRNELYISMGRLHDVVQPNAEIQSKINMDLKQAEISRGLQQKYNLQQPVLQPQNLQQSVLQPQQNLQQQIVKNKMSIKNILN